MKQLRNFNCSGGENNNFDLSSDEGFRDAMNKYGGMGEDELINQLLVSVRNSRANGTYNPAQMEGYAEMLKPHITSAQYEKLKNIIKLINSENV